MITQEKFFEDYKETLEDFLGLRCKFIFNKDNSLKEIEFIKFEASFLEFIKKDLHKIFSVLKTILLNFYKEYNTFEFKPLFKKIFLEELAYGFIDPSYPQKNTNLDNFLESIKKVCIKTYESQDTQMSFIIFNNSSTNINNYLDNKKLKFIGLKKQISLQEFLEDKLTLKIIDSKSISFVLNANFKVVGLAQKKIYGRSIDSVITDRYGDYEKDHIQSLSLLNYAKKHLNYLEETSSANEFNDFQSFLKKEFQEKINYIKSLFAEFKNEKSEEKKLIIETKIESKMEELNKFMKVNQLKFAEFKDSLKTESAKVNELRKVLFEIKKESKKSLEDISYIYFKNKQIIWHNSFDYTISFLNGQWKLRNHFILRNILAKFIMLQYPNTNPLYMHNKLKESAPKIFNLYTMIKNLSENHIGSLVFIAEKSQKQKTTLYKELLQDKKLSTGIYNSIIKSPADKNLNISSLDSYLFELIASIDGAILFDYKLDILSFGEMIKDQINEDQNSSTKIYRGARTRAAYSASKFGLSLKISEDGDIQIFENQKEIARI